MGHVTHPVNAAIKAETPKDRALAGEYEKMKLISHNETIYIKYNIQILIMTFML